MKNEEIIENYRNIIGSDSIKSRNLIKKLEFQEDGYLLQCIAQTYLDECRFEIDGSMRLYIDKRKWRMAERYIIKAFILDPNNAEVLYTMGNVRRTIGQNDIAIYCYEKIIKLGAKKISLNKYSRGIDFARELINDSKFELYRLYYKENKVLSGKYLVQYKRGIKKGITTIYNPLTRFLLN